MGRGQLAEDHLSVSEIVLQTLGNLVLAGQSHEQERTHEASTIAKLPQLQSFHDVDTSLKYGKSTLEMLPSVHFRASISPTLVSSDVTKVPKIEVLCMCNRPFRLSCMHIVRKIDRKLINSCPRMRKAKRRFGMPRIRTLELEMTRFL